MAPLRLAILEADTPQPQTRDRFGGYTGVFTALLQEAAKPQKLEDLVTIKGYDVVNELHSYPSLDEIDAVLITGSRHTAFDNDPWIIKLVEFTKKAIDTNRIRVVGVCFGHQIVGRAEGAKLGRSNKGWEVAVTEVDLTDKGKEIFGLDKMVRPICCARDCTTVSLTLLHSAFTKCIATL
jgi:GMP synthase-like glutamine amidotransferase